MSHSADQIETSSVIQEPSADSTDPIERRLRALWTANRVPQHRQDEILTEIAAKAQPGVQIGPFRVTPESDANPKPRG